MTNILYYLHFLIPLTIILMPLLPNKYLIYVFPYPIIYYFIWLMFDNKCPLTEISQTNMEDKENFILPLFQQCINKNITETQVNGIINIIICSSIIISAYKLLYSCRKRKTR
uniref:DUF2784 family protein n=1 Tax=viral metagenome TaxID=1070528 RepID=A0A6C0JMI1_9ZZZZ